MDFHAANMRRALDAVAGLVVEHVGKHELDEAMAWVQREIWNEEEKEKTPFH